MEIYEKIKSNPVVKYLLIYISNYLLDTGILVITFNLIYKNSNHLGLISGILFGALLIAAHHYRRHSPVKYALAAMAFISFILSILLSNFAVEQLTTFIYYIPILYAFLLNDMLSASIVGITISCILVRHPYELIPYRLQIDMALEMVFISIATSIIIYLIRNLIKERNNYIKINAELEEANEKLQHSVFHDSLTGLPNRTFFINRLEDTIAVQKAHNNYLFAVAFVELDRFKIINDTLGHNNGDELLFEIARRLKKCLRSTDTVARLGGDEFVILLDDIKDVRDVTHMVGRIMKELENPFDLCSHKVIITASIGIVLSNNDYNRPEEYLRDADIAMYHAKALGRNRYEIFDLTMSQNVQRYLKIENELRCAIEHHELQIYYQPIISLQTEKITGFEALLRWQHPEIGMISPAEFIPVAEETGLIVSIGKWVLYEACRQIKEWQKQISMDPPLTISVNFSAIQLMQPDLIEQIKKVLQDTNLDPGSLNLEITESVIINDINTAQSVLNQIRNLGVGIHIDDFGTGYSSLSYLYQLPFDAVKVDRSFINQFNDNNKKRELVKSIISMTHGLGMKVIAEGIESIEQAAQLRELECDVGQGYYFYKPMDSKAAENLLREYLDIATQFQTNPQ